MSKLLIGIAAILFAISIQCINGFEYISCGISLVGLAMAFLGYLSSSSNN